MAERPRDAIVTSAATGMGLDELRSAIARDASQPSKPRTICLPAPARGAGAACALAESSLRAAAESLRERSGDELVAFDLRSAVDELGKVVGAVVTDDILDRIFRRFCIGK